MESCSSIEKKLRWVLPDRMAFSKANPTSPVSLISSSIRFTGKEDVLDIAEYNRFGPIPSSLLLHTGNTCPIMKRVTIGSSSSLTSLRKFETFVVISRGKYCTNCHGTDIGVIHAASLANATKK